MTLLYLKLSIKDLYGLENPRPVAGHMAMNLVRLLVLLLLYTVTVSVTDGERVGKPVGHAR